MHKVYRDFWPGAADFLPSLREQVEAYGSHIFNPDRLRHQTALKPNSDFYRAFDKALTDRGFVRGRTITDAFVLQSYEGCRRQQFHTDYDADLLAAQGSRKKPQGCLLALEKDTTLEVKEGPGAHTVRLGPGDLLVFDGDCVHAGSAYDRPNTRVHCYLDVATHAREPNKTWFA